MGASLWEMKSGTIAENYRKKPSETPASAHEELPFNTLVVWDAKNTSHSVQLDGRPERKLLALHDPAAWHLARRLELSRFQALQWSTGKGMCAMRMDALGCAFQRDAKVGALT